MLPLRLGSGSRGLGILLLDLAYEKTLKVFIRLIGLLHLQQHCRLHIRQANGDVLYLPQVP